MVIQVYVYMFYKQAVLEYLSPDWNELILKSLFKTIFSGPLGLGQDSDSNELYYGLGLKLEKYLSTTVLLVYQKDNHVSVQHA